ncbi:MAG: helix-turn-helix domain-containing protein [Candidatus Nanohaloarchaea archaeon]
MAWFFRDDDRLLEAEQVDPEGVKALEDESRLKIMRMLAEDESYPARIAEKLDIGKQKTYYHFKKLKEADLVEKSREEKKSGGLATFYTAAAESFVVDLGAEGKPRKLPEQNPEMEKFLDPLVRNGSLEGKIVVGSPDEHGPDQVRARDGHLASEIGLKLGTYAETGSLSTVLDTEVFRDESFGDNMLLLGGVLTNTVTKKFNDCFPVSFEGEEFPYREIRTPSDSYSDGEIGVIARTENPEKPGNALYMVAGVRNRGTRAAVMAFKNLEDLIHDYGDGEFYCIVRGLDMDGDGKIDSYEVVE